jgi:predicted nucleic acid-binding protein
VSYLLDTNVISELIKPEPETAVLEWFQNVPEEKLFLCVLTLGELQAGVESLPESRKKNDLIMWFEEIKESFGNQMLPINDAVALKWGDLNGWKLPVIDGLIAACALHNSAILVTRNTKDFEKTGVEVLNPWL